MNLTESVLSTFWVLPWVKNHNLINCLILNPKEVFIGVINLLVFNNLGSLKTPFLIKLVSELELLWMVIESKPVRNSIN